MRVNINPELQFLMQCTQPEGDTIVEKNIDGKRLVSLAEEHRLLPLLTKHIDTTSAANIPEDILKDLRKRNIANTVRNTYLSHELIRIITSLRGSDIDCVALKGSVLAQEAYGDISLRQFDDIDILVTQDKVIRAARIMQEHGYTPFIDMPDHIRVKHVNAGWGFSLKSPESDYHLEILSNIVPNLYPFSLPENMLFENCEEVIIEGEKICTLNPTNNLIALCVHGAKHGWQRLLWIADIAGFIRSNKIKDWNKALATAERCGSLRMLYLGLDLAREVADASLPSELIEKISKDPTTRKLTKQIIVRMDKEIDLEENSSQDIAFQIAVRELYRDKLKYLLSLLFVPGYGDWCVVDLPTGLKFLYYIIRPFRILCQRMVTDGEKS